MHYTKIQAQIEEIMRQQVHNPNLNSQFKVYALAAWSAILKFK